MSTECDQSESKQSNGDGSKEEVDFGIPYSISSSINKLVDSTDKPTAIQQSDEIVS